MRRIKAARLKLGWNQTELAFRSRLNVGDISRIENGRLIPYPKQLARIATALGVAADLLLQEMPELPLSGTSRT